MRLAEIERGDSIRSRLLIRLISMMLRARLPDAARVAFYHRDFAGHELGAWTQRAMRGPSAWTVGERELMAALVGQWNSNIFCVGAHSAIAIRGMDRSLVDAAMADYHTAPISDQLRTTLVFLEKMTRQPGQLTDEDARTALAAGVTRDQLVDASAVAAVFNIITRYADALDFTIPSHEEYEKSARMLFKRGYG
jgi:uncharacterized peroxidase-related enzyme